MAKKPGAKQGAVATTDGLPRFNGNQIELKSDEQGVALLTMLCTRSTAVATDHLTKATAGKSKATDSQNDAGLRLLAEIAPQTPLEVMLATQMIQVHDATERCLRIFANPDNGLEVKIRYADLATKFQRTFTTQIEALQRLRGNGGQKVRVEHVHVHEGGQAIVGNVEGGGGKNGR